MVAQHPRAASQWEEYVHGLPVVTVQLLVPLDGSDKDLRAVQVADAMAGLVDGRINYVRILETPATIASPGLALIDAVPETVPRDRAAVEAEMRAIISQLPSASRENVSCEVGDAVDVVAELLRRAESADIVVMASRMPGTVKRAFLGSVADEVVRKASCPVIIVPPGARYGAGQRIRISRVLAPLDGSVAGRAAIDRLAQLVPAGQLEYVLMQVVRQERSGGHEIPTPGGSHIQARQAEKHLGEIADQCSIAGQHTQTRVVESGDPAGAIVAAVRAELVDMIAMSTRGAGGAHRALHGSVANRVARESEVPLFLLTPSMTAVE